MRTEFTNEPLTDFKTDSGNRAYEAGLRLVETKLGAVCPLIIGGARIETARRAPSIDPARRDRLVGIVCQADEALAERAVQAAAAAYGSWREVAPEARARYLFRAGALLRRRRHEFAAWMTLEAGKNRAEADADVAEAIDFMEFYAREMQRLALPQPLTASPDEENELYYTPLGVGVVIPPWNFPLAIVAGMTCAAIVCGNTVVLKPASPTPVVAARFVELLEQAGLPPGVVNFLPGPGAEIGDYLVEHRLTRFVSFTGSRDVGLRINERAAVTQPGQRWIKRVVLELGGKDAIVVDADADLELAANAIVASAFGYAGQKCSACSRAIVHQDVYDAVLEKVVAQAGKLTVGDPAQAATDVGPVIDGSAYRKIVDYIDIGRREGRLALGGGANDSTGWFVEPTIFADVPPRARIAQEEIFGPVLAFTRAASFDEALAIANDSDYGLTGAVISNDRSHLEQARRDFAAGNLYFNRKCTGAFVGVHPFGGFNLSGTDSKAGGRDYLLLFTQAKVVSERY